MLAGKKCFLSLLVLFLCLSLFPTWAYADESVKPLVFETLTLEGKEISSEELFRDNQFTVVNVWASWCKPCVEELEELSKLHTRLQKQSCGVIGILWDGETAREEGQRIAEEKRVNYPNVLLCEKMDMLTELTVFPTTFFVDAEGRPVAEAIEGAKVEKYEEAVRSLLNKKAAGVGTALEMTENPAGKESGAQRPAKNADSSSSAVPEGMTLICDGDSCILVSAEMPDYTEHVSESADKPESASDTSGQEEPYTEEANDYPFCSGIAVRLSDTEIIAIATGEYAGLDGEHPVLP